MYLLYDVVEQLGNQILVTFNNPINLTGSNLARNINAFISLCHKLLIERICIIFSVLVVKNTDIAHYHAQV